MMQVVADIARPLRELLLLEEEAEKEAARYLNPNAST